MNWKWILFTAFCQSIMFCATGPLSHDGSSSGTTNALVRGVVLHSDSTPASDAMVEIYGPSRHDPTVRKIGSVTTGADGTFAFDSLYHGTFVIQASDHNDSLMHATLSTYHIDSLQDTAFLPEITLQPAGELNVSVADSNAYRSITITATLSYLNIPLRTGTLDSNAMLTFTHLAPGEYKLTLTPSGSDYLQFSQSPIAIQAGQIDDISINQLPVAASIARSDIHAVNDILAANGLSLNIPEVAKATLVGDSMRIAELQLSNRDIAVLPASIGNLSYLTTLELSHNELFELPDTLGALAKLEVLELGYNNLKSLPASITRLASLQTLRVNANTLTNLPNGIGDLANLKQLVVSDNMLFALPTSIGKLHNLTHLHLEFNNLSMLTAQIGKLSNLEFLAIQNNELASLPAEIGKLSSLENLSVKNNNIAALPDELTQLTQLKFLWLDYNELQQLPAKMHTLLALHTLTAVQNRLYSIPDSIGQLTRLKEMALDSNRLTDLPASLLELDLDFFSISGNRLCTLESALASWLNVHNSNWQAGQHCLGGSKQALYFTYPSGGETFMVGGKINLQWETNPLYGGSTINGVKLEISVDGGLNWFLIDDAINRSSPEWGNYRFIVRDTLIDFQADTLSTSLVSSNCIFRITSYGLKYFDFTDSAFTVLPRREAIELTSPAALSEAFVGDTITIGWKADRSRIWEVNCSLSVDAGATWMSVFLGSPYGEVIDIGEAAWGAFAWEIPDSLWNEQAQSHQSVVSDSCLLKISDRWTCGEYEQCYFNVTKQIFSIRQR
ncbi:MAG: hypothetical protein GF398_05995 [Chitinivibrionales bacterium]|nr:hypothetical protein [Chitinivibrionales bacterium]